jgi:hypothetical protein
VSENEEPTQDDLLSILNDAALLKEEGYHITPKGHMAMVLMEMGVTGEDAAAVAQKMEDRIFLNGWIYLQESQLILTEGKDG